ncbi:DUF6286 domain-containing protein [Streptomyces sp. NPDC003444]
MTAPADVRGTTRVADRAVRRIAERAAAEAVSTRGALTGVTTRVRGRHVRMSVETALDGEDGTPLADAARTLQEHVRSRTARLTGLDVSPPRIGIAGLSLPAAGGGEAASPSPRAEGGGGPAGDRRKGRRWSSRRPSTAVLVSVCALLATALLVDVTRVRLLGHPAVTPYAGVLDRLATHRPGDPPVTVLAAVVAATGVLLLALAVLPGRRGLWTVASPAGLRGTVDRTAVESSIRGAVTSVPGVGRVRVRASRRRVTVRADLRFGDLPAASDRVAEAAGRALDACLPGRPPRLRVVVRPHALGGPGRAAADDDHGHDALPEGGEP